MRKLVPIALLALWLGGCQNPQHPDDTANTPRAVAQQSLVVAQKDFASDLPEGLGQASTERKTAEIAIDDQARFKLLVHYDQLTDKPDLFRQVEVELAEPAEVEVKADIGLPTNLGTPEAPRMTVPIKIEWSGSGWSRARMFTLHPDGNLIADE